MDTNEKRRMRAPLRFFAAAAAAQLLMSLLWSAPTLERIFPLCSRAVSETVTLGDRSYTEYYPIRCRVTEADVQLIVIGVDFSCAESYSLLTDLFTSLKNDVNIGTVLVDDRTVDTAAAAAVIDAEEPETRQAALAELALCGARAQYASFLETLSESKEDYPPSRRYVGGSLDVAEGADSYAQMLLYTAQTYYGESGRPVLAVIDTAYLQTDAGLRAYLAKNLPQSLCIQCRYETRRSIFGESTPEIRIVDSADLVWFDDLYARAEMGADGRYRATSFSDRYSTEIYFTLYNGTAAT